MRRDRGVALEIANPYFAVIASEAKQSIAQQVEKWIASLALAMTGPLTARAFGAGAH